MTNHDFPAAARAEPQHWGAADTQEWLRAPSAIEHKVSRGVLAARIGSAQYPGAAVLGVSAAWRTGIGMVRYVSPIGDAAPLHGLPTPAAAVLAARPETLFGEGNCDAWLLGSGTDPATRDREETSALQRLQRGNTPLVIDAGALGSVLDREPGSAPAVLTPHLGEFRRVCAGADIDCTGLELGGNAEPKPVTVATALRLSARLSATILLKGSKSVIVTPGGRTIVVGPATPWLATAGTGDVLAGILGALVARHSALVLRDPEVLAPLAATAALVHDMAARIASGDDSRSAELCVGAPITALDVANEVSLATQQLRHLAQVSLMSARGEQQAQRDI